MIKHAGARQNCSLYIVDGLRSLTVPLPSRGRGRTDAAKPAQSCEMIDPGATPPLSEAPRPSTNNSARRPSRPGRSWDLPSNCTNATTSASATGCGQETDCIGYRLTTVGPGQRPPRHGRPANQAVAVLRGAGTAGAGDRGGPVPISVYRKEVFPMRLLTVSLFALASGFGAEPTPRDTLNAGRFPLAVGHRWVYAFGDREVTFEVVRAERQDDLPRYVVRRTIDKAQVDFTITVEEDGVYIHQEGKKEFRPPLRQFAFFARTGDAWKWRGTAGGKREEQRFEHLGIESVTVPAGTFPAVAVSQNNPDTVEHATFWLARDVGVVKVSGKTEVLTDGPDRTPVQFEWTLKRFE